MCVLLCIANNSRLIIKYLFLLPEREMARLKERSKAERERRHLERALKRKQEEEQDYHKKLKLEEPPQVSLSI